MMTVTQITRPAASYHPEMSLGCSIRRDASTTFSARFFSRYPLDTGDAVCSIPAILQHPENTPLQYLSDTPMPLSQYRRDTHLIESQDDVSAGGSTGGAKLSKRSAARAAPRTQSSSQTSKPKLSATGQRQRPLIDLGGSAKQKRVLLKNLAISNHSGPKQ
jgi:hypothetical protein